MRANRRAVGEIDPFGNAVGGLIRARNGLIVLEGIAEKHPDDRQRKNRNDQSEPKTDIPAF